MTDLNRKNKKTLIITLSFVACMVGIAYASVPLYRMICQVTGWGGTTQMVDVNPHKDRIFDRKITVRFNTDVARDMPWSFRPDIAKVDVRVGQDGIVSFLAENKSDKPVKGTAVYNVTPLKAGKYFFKTQCFCFGEQVLNPGEKVHMPVTFFVDPDMLKDPEMRDVKTITLSYTFFRHNSDDLSKAVEKYYNESNGIN